MILAWEEYHLAKGCTHISHAFSQRP